MNRRISLRYILFVICMSAALLPALMVSSWLKHQVQQNETALVQDKHLLIARNLSTALSRYAADTSAIFNSVNQQISHHGFHSELRPLLKSINIYALFEWQVGRGQRFYFSEQDITPFETIPAQIQVAMELARVYKDQAFYSGVVIEGVTKPTLFLTTYQGQDRYLLAALTTDYLLESQSEVRFGDQGHVALFDQFGRVLAHPNQQWATRAKDLSGLDPIVQMRDQPFGVSQFYSPALQADMIAGYSRVEGPGWGVIVPQPIAELQSQSMRLQEYAFLVSILCVMVVGVITWYLSCVIVRPISQVVEAAQGISHGEMGKFVTPKRRFISIEMDSLVGQFNAMAGEVYTSRTLLEQRVKQRTAALSKEVAVRKKAEEQVWQQANFDPLTGLPNRRMLNRLLSDALATRLAEERVCLMLLDLDQFKGINDTLGHDMGDMLLQIAAQRIQHCILQGEHVARLGGDEFIILLSENEEGSRVAELGDAVLKTLSTPFQLGIERVYISTSIGVAFAPQDGDKIDDLLKHADQAMYVAKQQGRNRLSYFTASLQEQAQVRRLLANDLRQAVAKKQLCVHYQPIVDLASGEMIKAEVLVRWNHPTQGWISPHDFIHVAEETGVIVEIGNWVFSSAVAQLKHWKEQGLRPIQLSINTSPKQYYEAECDVNHWLSQLAEAGLSSADVVMEITEGLLMENSPVVNAKLLAFSEAGVEVALDDFGTGYSSLAYLQKFDIEYLKIDRMFIHNLAEDGDDLIVCKAIIVMAHKLGIQVIAEGIESEHQARLLREAGCDFAQGYWFAKPLAKDDFEALLNGEAMLLPHNA
ncbi:MULTISPECIES: EAL domain-containing protein [unclassified Agarivorans]|uniref:EAL domain-containing protein n=1 Tax=unclassified Agarivorans TaxID=2636026 RepID=UPI0026E421B1|nr:MULTISPECIES: EAL domain-containing protein [unclassified Agarivorans]MDO6685311.1 EAL domain-containing protein [Agarivorans sp. 3_MG-2023]MDO6715517.1 EAL domain-containing protein [Agarivorans sp. 2_MG-2023]